MMRWGIDTADGYYEAESLQKAVMYIADSCWENEEPLPIIEGFYHIELEKQPPARMMQRAIKRFQSDMEDYYNSFEECNYDRLTGWDYGIKTA